MERDSARFAGYPSRCIAALAPAALVATTWRLLPGPPATRVVVCAALIAVLAAVRRGRRPWVAYALAATAGLTVLPTGRPTISPTALALSWGMFAVVAIAMGVLASRVRTPLVVPLRRDALRGLWIPAAAGLLAVGVTIAAAMIELPPMARATQWLSLAVVGIVVACLVQRLRWQARLLSEVDDLKSRFVALTNHELRTPVAVLHSALETLEEDLEGSLTPQQAGFLQAARASSRDLATRVDMLTQLHRLQLELRADDRRLPFGDIYEDVTRELMAGRRDVALRATMSDEAAATPVPSADTAVVLRQLVHNALKFSPAGGEVHIQARLSSGVLEWSVLDQGPGVPMSQRSAIFEAFYQPGDLLRRDGGGMGVGLSLARLAAERMGARLQVKNGPGRGACFAVLMPTGDAAPIPFPLQARQRQMPA